MSEDRNCLSWWFPRIDAAGLPVPETRIVTTELELGGLIDGEAPDDFYDFVAEVAAACESVGFPAFLRTGHGSGKHEWTRTCFVPNSEAVGDHVVALVEWSHLADFFALPHQVWAARRMIETAPLFHAFEGMPIVREFRFFVRDGEVEHVQPYWPPDSIEDPSAEDWEERLAAAALLPTADYDWLERLARRAGRAVGGYWSVDFLQGALGGWWLTDMALGEQSFRWEP